MTIRKDLKTRMILVADALQKADDSTVAPVTKQAAPAKKNFNLGDPVCITKNVLVLQPGGRQTDVKKGTKGVISGITQKSKGRYKVNFHGTDVIVPEISLKFDRTKAPRPEVTDKPIKAPKQPKQPKPLTKHVAAKTKKANAAVDVKEVAKEAAKGWAQSGHLPAGPTTAEKNTLHDALGRDPSPQEWHDFATVFKEHLKFKNATVKKTARDRAVRYCGTLKLLISYVERAGSYNVAITEMNDDARFKPLQGIKMSPHDAGRIAADSNEAFDKVAKAAISFGAHEDDAVSNYAEYDPNGEAKIRRKETVASVKKVAMDPTATFKQFLAEKDIFHRSLLADDLLTWLNKGGAEPEHERWFGHGAKGRPSPKQWTRDQLRNWITSYNESAGDHD